MGASRIGPSFKAAPPYPLHHHHLQHPKNHHTHHGLPTIILIIIISAISVAILVTAFLLLLVFCRGKLGLEQMQVDLMSRLHSPYLVGLLGYCADHHHRILISEFMPNGSLQRHLHQSDHEQHSQPLNWGTRLRIALDCARALEFLHEHAVPSVIHRDFKCSNIVLDHNFRAKLSDLGSAKTGSDKINGQSASRVLGTTGYLAPE